MTTLYPRLLDADAEPIFTEYKSALAEGHGIEYLAGKASTTHLAAVYVATGGTRASHEHLQSLRDAVLALAHGTGFPGDSRNMAWFDTQLAQLLHQHSGMVPAEAAARDVWQFLALCLLPDVAFWRYPNPPGDRVLGTDLTRHVFGRLWWRAQLVHDPKSQDPYAGLQVMGEAAFDQIYARRAVLGGSPALVRGILEVWQKLEKEGQLRGLTQRKVLQDYLKRLLRLFPFVDFDSLQENDRKLELWVVAEETVESCRRESSKASAPV
ncbi:DUF6339 family protein [Kocuria rosea]|uniref:DUF6339 family protein n=1 Tax=Kocuria rosea TaxID=1275 RepID=UPI000F71ADEB|nr:DUF6339 family protein [Kocuria rosea]MEB2527402.1 DUF6339 family protein [Kocuria rosea]MEB2617549.1 DUF6339 family protein [Kocuria rosea]VEH41298.1 Uncharacterised protein [Kocuria rosea]